MKKLLYILIVYLFGSNTIGFSQIKYKFKFGNMTEDQFEQAMRWYLNGEYDKCINLAKTARGHDKYTTFVKAYGALSVQIKKESFVNINRDEIFQSMLWAKSASKDLDELIKDEEINDYSSAKKVVEFFDLINLARGCAHIISDRLYNYGRVNKYDKQNIKYIELAHKKTYRLRNTWKQTPVVHLLILDNSAHYFAFKDKSSKRLDSSFMSEFWDCINRIVLKGDDDNDFSQSAIVMARTRMKSISQLLVNLFLKQKKEKITPIIDFLLKSQDFTLYINGAKQYRHFKDVTWKSIQTKLKDDEYALIHFEGTIMAGMLYDMDDSNSRIRNYAVLFNNNMSEPILWSRGFRDKIETKDFLSIKEDFPSMRRLYVTGTDFMMLKDIIGTDNISYRLHSLSELPLIPSIEDGEILMIADIDFSNIRTKEDVDSIKGIIRSEKLKKIPGDKTEIETIKSLFGDNAIILSDSMATRQALFSKITNKQILHISSHGIFDETILSSLNDDYYLGGFIGNNILNSCRIALSGYNEDTKQYISALDIKKMDLSHINLVFLDACETGAGKTTSGGTYSLAEAFHMAGVKNIIANLDPIGESVATKFTESFYTKIKQGESLHDAFYESKMLICPNQRIIFWE